MKCPVIVSCAESDYQPAKLVADLLSDAGLRTSIGRPLVLGKRDWSTDLKESVVHDSTILLCVSSKTPEDPLRLVREIRTIEREAERLKKEKPRIIVVRLDDCRIPNELEHLETLDLYRFEEPRILRKSLESGLRCTVPAPRKSYEKLTFGLKEFVRYSGDAERVENIGEKIPIRFHDEDSQEEPESAIRNFDVADQAPAGGGGGGGDFLGGHGDLSGHGGGDDTGRGGGGSGGGSDGGGTNPPSSPPAEGPPPTDNLPRFLIGRFPDRVKPQGELVLEARIALAKSAKSAELQHFLVPPEGVDVLLVIEAPDFQVLDGAHRVVRVEFRGESPWVAFTLRAQSEGVRTISLRAYVGGTYQGELKLEVQVNASFANSDRIEKSDALDFRVRDPSEVTLEIHYDDSPSNRYRYRWIDASVDLDELPGEPLRQPREQFVNQLISELNGAARGSGGYSPQSLRALLEGIGTMLWRGLIPERLEDQFRRNQDGIKRVTTLSSGDPMPWELLFPPAEARLPWTFLAEQFDVTRRLFGPHPTKRLTITKPYFILPPDSPATASDEVRAISQILKGCKLSCGNPIGLLDQLLTAIDAADFDLLHFACHNNVQPTSLSVSRIDMSKGSFTTTFLENKADKFRPRAPLVFMNACRTDAQDVRSTSLSGWARSFLNAGAGAFIGTLWEVRDASARDFAEAFYQSAAKGTTFGGAVQCARRKIAAASGDPTWLAYAIYGDPSAELKVGATS